MDRRACASLLIVLIGVLLALAGPVSAGGMKATFAAGVGATRDVAVLWRLMSARLEDRVAPELSVDLELHRRVLASTITPDVLDRNQLGCIVSCPAPGGHYIPSRDCLGIYHCPHSPN